MGLETRTTTVKLLKPVMKKRSEFALHKRLLSSIFRKSITSNAMNGPNDGGFSFTEIIRNFSDTL
jgi:hypothetical protein